MPVVKITKIPSDDPTISAFEDDFLHYNNNVCLLRRMSILMASPWKLRLWGCESNNFFNLLTLMWTIPWFKYHQKLIPLGFND